MEDLEVQRNSFGNLLKENATSLLRFLFCIFLLYFVHNDLRSEYGGKYGRKNNNEKSK